MNTKHPVLNSLIEKIGDKSNYLQEQVKKYDHLKELQNKDGNYYTNQIEFCRIRIRTYLIAMCDFEIIDTVVMCDAVDEIDKLAEEARNTADKN